MSWEPAIKHGWWGSSWTNGEYENMWEKPWKSHCRWGFMAGKIMSMKDVPLPTKGISMGLETPMGNWASTIKGVHWMVELMQNDAHIQRGYRFLRRTCVQLVSQIALHHYSLHVWGKTDKPGCIEPKLATEFEWQHPRNTWCPAECTPFRRCFGSAILGISFNRQHSFATTARLLPRRKPTTPRVDGTCTVDDNEAGSLRHWLWGQWLGAMCFLNLGQPTRV